MMKGGTLEVRHFFSKQEMVTDIPRKCHTGRRVAISVYKSYLTEHQPRLAVPCLIPTTRSMENGAIELASKILRVNSWCSE